MPDIDSAPCDCSRTMPPSSGSPLEVSTFPLTVATFAATSWMSMAASVLACTCTFTASAGLTVPGPYVGIVSTSTFWRPWLPLKKLPRSPGSATTRYSPGARPNIR